MSDSTSLSREFSYLRGKTNFTHSNINCIFERTDQYWFEMIPLNIVKHVIEFAIDMLWTFSPQKLLFTRQPLTTKRTFIDNDANNIFKPPPFISFLCKNLRDIFLASARYLFVTAILDLFITCLNHCICLISDSLACYMFYILYKASIC